MNINKAPGPINTKERVPEEVRVLDCKPGHWRTLVEEVSFEGKYPVDIDNTDNFEEQEGVIVVPEGAEINVLGQETYPDGALMNDGKVSIKIHEPNKQSFYIHVSAGTMQDKKIKVESV